MKASTNLVKESNKDTVYILLDNLKYPFGELPTFNRICSGDKIT